MGRAAVPDWVARADQALATAAARIRVVGSSTPVNLSREFERLLAVWTRGGGEAPRFEYAPPPSLAGVRAALMRAAEALEGEGELGALYAARAQELEVEAAICEAAGGAGCWAAARRRYAARDEFDPAADALSAAWLAGDPGSEDPAGRDGARGTTWSDDERASGSLVSRMRQEVGARRLPFRVLIVEIAPLAATGDGTIQVAARRRLRPEDVERTVLHEIEGHAAPAARGASMPLGIFAFGTARGSDDQEGRALWLERAAGFLGASRRRELGLRHVAARSVERGADFVETARLVLASGAPGVGDALRIAARVHRGGGLGREAVYLPALLRVEAALAAQPGLADVLGAGRVSVDAAPVLVRWMQG